MQCIPCIFLVVTGSMAQITTSYYCSSNVNTNSNNMRVVFRMNTNVITGVTGIGLVFASEDPTFGSGTLDASACSSAQMTVISPTVYELDFEIDTTAASLACGAQDMGAGLFKFSVGVLEITHYFNLQCDINNLLESTVQQTSFATTPVVANKFASFNPTGVEFQVVEADIHSPVSNVDLGQNIMFRVIYNNGFQNLHGGDNCGYNFQAAFFPHTDPDAELILQLVTRGLGTRVRIIGVLTSHPIDMYIKIKRDTAVEVHIPRVYQQTDSTGTTWHYESKALHVEALDDCVGLRVITRSSSEESSYVAVPFETLMDTFDASHTLMYRLSALVHWKKSGPILKLHHIVFDIYKLSPSISFKYLNGRPRSYIVTARFAAKPRTYFRMVTNNMNIPGLADEGGISLPSSTAYTTYLDMHEVFHLVCNPSCHNLVIDAMGTGQLGPVIVVAGHSAIGFPPSAGNTGLVMTQLTPYVSYAQEFVLLFPAEVSATYLVNNADPNSGTFNIENPGPTFTTAGNQDTVDKTDLSNPSEIAMEAKTDEAVTFYMRLAAADNTHDPSVMAYPSIAQWSPRQSFYATEGYIYDLYIVGYKNEIADITVTTRSITLAFGHQRLGLDTNFVSLISDVPRTLADANAGKTIRYESYKNIGGFIVTDTDSSVVEGELVELRSDKIRKPFMLIVVERDSNGKYRTTHLAYETRYPAVATCTPTSASGLPGLLAYYTVPGDLIDNDCDGRVDEETDFDTDDDGDGLVAEDLALKDPVATGIYIEDLIMSTESSFSTSTTIISGGCNVNDGAVLAERVYASIGDFTHNEDLDSVFDDLWVLDSDIFSAFKIINEDNLYFRVTFDFCYADFSLCEASCANTAIRKREVDRAKKHADLHVRINKKPKGIHASDTEYLKDRGVVSGPSHPCVVTPMFWVQVLVLVFIILIEVTTIVWMLHLKHTILKCE